MPAPSPECQHSEAWPARAYRHLGGVIYINPTRRRMNASPITHVINLFSQLFELINFFSKPRHNDELNLLCLSGDQVCDTNTRPVFLPFNPIPSGGQDFFWKLRIFLLNGDKILNLNFWLSPFAWELQSCTVCMWFHQKPKKPHFKKIKKGGQNLPPPASPRNKIARM